MDSQPNWTPQVSRYEDMIRAVLGCGGTHPYSGQHGYDLPPGPTEYLPFSQDSLPPEAGGM